MLNFSQLNSPRTKACPLLARSYFHVRSTSLLSGDILIMPRRKFTRKEARRMGNKGNPFRAPSSDKLLPKISTFATSRCSHTLCIKTKGLLNFACTRRRRREEKWPRSYTFFPYFFIVSFSFDVNTDETFHESWNNKFLNAFPNHNKEYFPQAIYKLVFYLHLR